MRLDPHFRARSWCVPAAADSWPEKSAAISQFPRSVKKANLFNNGVVIGGGFAPAVAHSRRGLATKGLACR